ncbi:hypothetical protein N0V82_008273 [Gnomoniopsis sp. IMI 355080]|nr:hypothetical protein N0V82_008273 [Gnomoniopsis sp. IMI 355080]
MLDMLDKSPLTFKFVSEPLESIQSKSSPGGNPMSVASPIDLHFIEGENQTVKREQADPSTAESDPIKTFTLWVKPSGNEYNHKTIIRRNPIHGPWPEVKKSDHDFAYYALKEVVPDSVAQHGLCDWTTGGQLSEDVKLARTDEESGGHWHIRDRIERRRNRTKATVDGNEMVSWTSIKAALQPRDEARDDPIHDSFDEAFAAAFDPNSEHVAKSSELGSGSETVSEPLRIDNQQSQTRDPRRDLLNGEQSRRNQAPLLDLPPNGGDSTAKSASQEIMQKLLEMPTSRKAAPSLEPALGSLRSESNDNNGA